MDNLLNLTLEAHHATRNHHRWYSVTIGIDLLHDWNVCIRYGRCGYDGQERRFAGPDAATLGRIVREHLTRRLSAPKRIGCAYLLVAFSKESGFDPTYWLPADVIATFYESSLQPS